MDFLSKPSVKTVLLYFSTISGQYVSLLGQLGHTIKVHLKGIITEICTKNTAMTKRNMPNRTEHYQMNSSK